MKQAHELNLPIFLTATPAAIHLYRKHGFQVVDEIAVDLSTARLTERRVNVCMVYPVPFPESPPKPLSKSWNIELAPVVDEADFIRFAVIEDAAFEIDPLMELAYPTDRSQPADPQHRANQHMDLVRTYPCAKFVKAYDTESGEMVGGAKWIFFDDPDRRPDLWPKEWSPGTNVPLCEFFFGALERKQNEHMGEKKYLLMGILVTMPEYQGRGIGSKLLSWGLDQADELGYECWINATQAGLSLYKRHGWMEVGQIDVDLGDWGGEKGKLDRTVCLVRRPRPKDKERKMA